MTVSWNQSRFPTRLRGPRLHVEGDMQYKNVALCVEQYERITEFVKTLGFEPRTFDGDIHRLLSMAWALEAAQR